MAPPHTQTAVDEHAALTTGCGLLDRSERGKLALTGEEAKALLAGQVTNDVEGLAPGTGCYAAFLTNKGKMLGDLRILDVGPPAAELWLDTERPALQALFDLIRRGGIGWKAELHKRTVQQALLSLIGPRAREVAGAQDLPDVEHANRRGEIGGRGVVLAVTDSGIDVICAAEDRDAVWSALADAGATEVAEHAAEAIRVAAGRPRYGIDLDDTVIPQEAGLNERAVSFSKGCYVGQETVARLHYKGKPNRRLAGLRLSGPAATGDPLRLGEREVGRVGSVADHPDHGPIALALLRREAQDGAQLTVADAGTTATVVPLPFT
jgi:tRNA-modifying protein YgfZ